MYWCWLLGGRIDSSKVWRVVIVRDKEYVLVLVTRGRIDSSKVWNRLCNGAGSKVWRVVAIMDKEYVLVLVTRGKNDSSKVWTVVVRYGGW